MYDSEHFNPIARKRGDCVVLGPGKITAQKMRREKECCERLSYPERRIRLATSDHRRSG
ncbi:hypothetical protein PSSHI_26620 [Photobacterium sp. R1]